MNEIKITIYYLDFALIAALIVVGGVKNLGVDSLAALLGADLDFAAGVVDFEFLFLMMGVTETSLGSSSTSTSSSCTGAFTFFVFLTLTISSPSSRTRFTFFVAPDLVDFFLGGGDGSASVSVFRFETILTN